MRCAALQASTFDSPVTKAANVSEGSSPTEDVKPCSPIVPAATAIIEESASLAGRWLSPPRLSSGSLRRPGWTEMRTLRTSLRAIFHASESRSAKRSWTQLAENSVGR